MPVKLRRHRIDTEGRDGEPMVGFGYLIEDETRSDGVRQSIDYGPRLWKKWQAATFPLAGESFHEAELRDASFEAGSRLLAVAEDNPYDEHAVAIWNATRTLHGGYIGRELAPTARQLLALDVEWYVLWEWRVEGRRTGVRVIAAQPGAITWPHETSAGWPPPMERTPFKRPTPSRRAQRPQAVAAERPSLFKRIFGRG